MAPRRGGASGEPEATASYVARIPQGTATYADVDAAFLRYDGLWTWFKVPSLHDSGPVAVRARDFLKQPRAWGRVAIPADIQRALGDAEVYVMVGGGNARMMRGVRANRFYDLPREINQFSLDGGLRCGPDNADLFVRVYTFFMAAYERLRLDVSFKEDRFTGITPARVDSLLNGAIPLVSAYRVRILSVLVSSDKGPGVELSTYRGSVGRIRAVVDWGDRLDSTKAEFASVHGFPGMSFPEYWDWGTEVRPWGLLLDSPHAPESRGGLDPVYFKVDDDNSYGVRIVTSGSPGGHVDSAAYAVVRDIASGTGITPPPRYEFRVMNVPPVGRPCTYVRLTPYDGNEQVVRDLAVAVDDDGNGQLEEPWEALDYLSGGWVASLGRKSGRDFIKYAYGSAADEFLFLEGVGCFHPDPGHDRVIFRVACTRSFSHPQDWPGIESGIREFLWQDGLGPACDSQVNNVTGWDLASFPELRSRDADDTFEVVVGWSPRRGGVPSFYFSPLTFDDASWYTPNSLGKAGNRIDILNDYDLYYLSRMGRLFYGYSRPALYRIVLGHEFQHAVQRAHLDGFSLGYRYAWLVEGLATFVGCAMDPAADIAVRTFYQEHVNQYLSNDAGENGRVCGLGEPDGPRYRFALYWRHLYEHGKDNNDHWMQIVKNVLFQFRNLTGSEDPYTVGAALMDNALASSVYGSFAGSFVGTNGKPGFAAYCFLADKPGWWYNPGQTPVYNGCLDAASEPVGCWKPEVELTYPFTFKIFRLKVERDKDAPIACTLDVAPYEDEAGVQVLKFAGAALTQDVFYCNRQGSPGRNGTVFENEGYDSVVACVCRLSGEPSEDHSYELKLSHGGRDVGISELYPRPGTVYYVPEGAYRGVAFRAKAFNADADSHRPVVGCRVWKDQFGLVHEFDGEVWLDTAGKPESEKWTGTDGGAFNEGLYLDSTWVYLENDECRRNDTAITSFEVRDTNDPNLPWTKFEPPPPPPLMPDGWLTRITTRDKSCWHIHNDDSMGTDYWGENPSYFACLTWHRRGLGESHDTLYSPVYPVAGYDSFDLIFRNLLDVGDDISGTLPTCSLVASTDGGTTWLAFHGYAIVEGHRDEGIESYRRPSGGGKVRCPEFNCEVQQSGWRLPLTF
jgi:hypothetical protein